MKNHFLSRTRNFISSKKGSVTIEFVFMLVLLLFIFAFLVDFVIVRTTQGKLDNATYSLVNILRERTQLYNDKGTNTLTTKDLQDFEKLAKLTLFGDVNSNKQVGVVLEHWWQDNGIGTSDAQSNLSNCQPYKKLNNDLAYLSPYSEISNQRKVPLYQVTLCIEVGSFFQSLIVKKENQSLGLLSSSSLAVAR
ncbi:pilus assembly protein TadF [Aggregatibacter segnis]|jgi:tadF|uniref:tight adherence pilus pseudopilin TadF n=1 Tax=Aggregatibacter segnis TaxID=739 RepID=UPI000DAEFCDF|nr:tight adherence pilus pseudopilin TadF [Aggregatibacter segnis]RDE68925.1 pilus assembly protein TadF [Aggregatibacter segnis]